MDKELNRSWHAHLFRLRIANCIAPVVFVASSYSLWKALEATADNWGNVVSVRTHHNQSRHAFHDPTNEQARDAQLGRDILVVSPHQTKKPADMLL
jgi:hypothetical protein